MRGVPLHRLVIQDDRNIVLYDSRNQVFKLLPFHVIQTLFLISQRGTFTRPSGHRTRF